MNIYRYEFMRRCPVDGRAISYELKIETPGVIMAEDLIEACGSTDVPTLHEPLADTLYERFGGEQRMMATHGLVHIETLRP